jgi:hypothetical protein
VDIRSTLQKVNSAKFTSCAERAVGSLAVFSTVKMRKHGMKGKKFNMYEGIAKKTTKKLSQVKIHGMEACLHSNSNPRYYHLLPAAETENSNTNQLPT